MGKVFIYSNSFTACKFVRMAIQMGLESDFQALRMGDLVSQTI